MHLKICAYNPMLTWYVMTTMGPSKDNSGLHALNMNGKTWTHCKCTCHCGMACCQVAGGFQGGPPAWEWGKELVTKCQTGPWTWRGY